MVRVEPFVQVWKHARSSGVPHSLVRNAWSYTMILYIYALILICIVYKYEHPTECLQHLDVRPFGRVSVSKRGDFDQAPCCRQVAMSTSAPLAHLQPTPTRSQHHHGRFVNHRMVQHHRRTTAKGPLAQPYALQMCRDINIHHTSTMLILLYVM